MFHNCKRFDFYNYIVCLMHLLQPVRNLVYRLEANNITVATQEVFLHDPSTQIKNLKVIIKILMVRRGHSVHVKILLPFFFFLKKASSKKFS